LKDEYDELKANIGGFEFVIYTPLVLFSLGLVSMYFLGMNPIAVIDTTETLCPGLCIDGSLVFWSIMAYIVYSLFALINIFNYVLNVSKSR